MHSAAMALNWGLMTYIHPDPVISLSSSFLSLHFRILSSLYDGLRWDEVTSKTARNMHGTLSRLTRVRHPNFGGV